MLEHCTPWPEEFAARYRAAGYWTGETFGALLTRLAAEHGERVAVVAGEDRWSYRELDERATRFARGLYALGVRPRDRVVVQLPNTAEFLEAAFALFRLGAIPVFSLPAHRANEVVHLAGHAGAVAYLTADRHAGFDYRDLARAVRKDVPGVTQIIVLGEAEEFTPFDAVRAAGDGTEPSWPAADPSDVALFQLSGGTTGTPKLIPRTHDDYLYSVRASAEICGLDATTVFLAALPVAHNFPMSSPGVFGVLHAGGKVVMSPQPAPSYAFPLIEREGVTLTGLVPPLAILWMETAATSPHDLSSLEVLQVGGARLSDEAAARVRPSLGCALQQVFGMAEGLVCYTRAGEPEEYALTTQGRPISEDDEIRIVDESGNEVAPGEPGELLTRGPYTIRGYYKGEEHAAAAFTPDGFYRTGDVVKRLESGHLIVSGREKDLINRGGEKVSAEEVENHLLAHPLVRDAAVVAVPDRFLGERSCAFVLPREEVPQAGELRAFLRSRGLATYKIPDRLEIVAEFPVTGVGKISKRDLRRALAAALTDPAQS
ncbi:(2,3-dihydroxybenzoyl)adenylate synthase [Actinocorallia sp. A-T 12471]|uniref:(2,3-dihydroxybenzoyl)adenylate synthase n=1 Tax=Actinocorallia sp. A-T 12471 TaxID=3089813 RepID=UPI0029CD0E88|nr:(2,3-dihydroxybenzoyl)adenylate synthase [Actinocorallia sp. A-T 12471]MDX6740075.1 (2,3-dihydroxybenzoyl)adenylate synthase [Actinocorallia sp. A-T 12471]